jgi:metal-responsive CopG/Arc/MetJ family transcriptional regulator
VRVRTSITLPADLLKRIDQADSNRSGFIGRALRVYLAHVRQARDVRIINAYAGRLNKEAMDVLDYQQANDSARGGQEVAT